MKITRCKLSKKVQRRLLEFYAAEVTARTAADLLNIQPNTAALFYHKINYCVKNKATLIGHATTLNQIMGRKDLTYQCLTDACMQQGL